MIENTGYQNKRVPEFPATDPSLPGRVRLFPRVGGDMAVKWAYPSANERDFTMTIQAQQLRGYQFCETSHTF